MPKTSVRIRSLWAVETLGEASSSANRGNALKHVLVDLGQLFQKRLDLALFLGRVDQGLGVAVGQLGRLVRDPSLGGPAALASVMRLSLRARWRRRGRQLLDGGVEQPAMLGRRSIPW